MDMTVNNPWWWIHPQHRQDLRTMLALLLALVALAITPVLFKDVFGHAYSIATYLPVHTLLETTAIVVAFLVFSVGWNADEKVLSGNLVLLSCLFFGVGTLDFLHTVSYIGMPEFITPNDSQKHLFYWLPARLMAALALLIVALRPWSLTASNAMRKLLLLGVGFLVVMVNGLVLGFYDSLPPLFVPGQGLTPLKKYTEYFVISINAVAGVLFWIKMRRPHPFNAALLFAACCVMAFGEVFFTFYTTMNGAYNIFGHVYKTLSYLLIYRAIVVEAIEAPYKRFSEAQQNLTVAAQASQTGLWEWDLLTGVIQRSKEATSLMGYPESDSRITAETLAGLLHPDDKEKIFQDLELQLAITKTDRPFDQEIRLRRRDGSFGWYLVRGVIHTNEQSTPVKLLGALVDISDRRQADERFRCAFEAAPNAMLMVNRQGQIVLANKQTSHLFGYISQELIGQPIHILIPSQYHQAHQAHLEGFMQAGTARGMFTNSTLNGKHKNGTLIPVEVKLTPLQTSQGQFVIASVVNIQERLAAEEKIQQLVYFDALTGLPNRTLLQDNMEQAIKSAQRTGGSLAVLYIDLDHFKNINDNLGHRTGDMLLIHVSKRIKGLIRAEDTLGRMGGDEFVLILPDTTSEDARRVAEKILLLLGMPIAIDKYQLKVTPSIGIVMSPDDGTDFDTLYQRSDTAMYHAKHEGRNQFKFFSLELQKRSQRIQQIENALHLAVERNQLSLVYQPQLNLATRRIIGVEALVRWKHPELGHVSPAEFIPVAENNGQIVEIGHWVLRTALRQLQDWLLQGLPPLVMAVNLSAVQFRYEGLADQIVRLLQVLELPPHYLELEITESVMANDPETSTALINELHSHGIAIAIDDFGTGYSSLSYLKNFKIDKLKIDQSFVRDLPGEGAIVNTIIQLANNLGFTTIAEGVESSEQLDFLQQQGCTEIQGYLFSKPLPAQELAQFFRQHQSQAHAEFGMAGGT